MQAQEISSLREALSAASAQLEALEHQHSTHEEGSMDGSGPVLGHGALPLLSVCSTTVVGLLMACCTAQE